MFRTFAAILAVVAVSAAATVSGEMVFDRGQLTLEPTDGMMVVSLGRCVRTWETGAPAVPIAVAQLVVPQNMKVTAVRADAVETETIPGSIDVYPVQPPQPLSDPGPFAYAATRPSVLRLQLPCASRHSRAPGLDVRIQHRERLRGPGAVRRREEITSVPRPGSVHARSGTRLPRLPAAGQPQRRSSSPRGSPSCEYCPEPAGHRQLRTVARGLRYRCRCAWARRVC
jgi:hypothetical protein